MKKALIVLLILAIAGGAFAQTFSGQIRTGALFDFSDDGVSVTAQEESWDSGQPVKARLDFANGGDDWGIAFGVLGDVPKDNSSPALTLNGAYGWVKFANIFTLSAGRGGIGDAWQATDWVDDRVGSERVGARLRVAPISGLDFGVAFHYPNGGASAGKIANFFQEVLVGAKYDAGIFVAGTTFQLDSVETTDPAGDTDVNWWLDAKIPLAGLFDIHFETHAFHLLQNKGDLDVFLGEKLAGNVLGISWNVWSKQANLTKDVAVTAGAELGYDIPLSDKATVSLGADLSANVTPDPGISGWDVNAKYAYSFNSNVSTYFKFNVAGDPDDITPTLKWIIEYNF